MAGLQAAQVELCEADCHFTAVIAAEDTARDMSEERMSEGDRKMFKFPGICDIEMSSSGGIPTTLSPTKRNRRRKKVKIIKKKETPNQRKISDTLITIPTLGEVSVLEPPLDMADIVEGLKKVEQRYIATNSGNQLSESSSNKFNFVLPDLGEAILISTEQHKTDDEGSNSLVKKHSLSHIAVDSKYPYFTKFPPFNKSFYKPRKFTLHRNRKIPIRRYDPKPLKRKPINILSKFVENSLNLLNLQGPKRRKPTRKHTSQHINREPSHEPITTNRYESGQTITEKFDINKNPFLPTSIPLDQMSQEFLLAHLVLVSIPLLFTGRLTFPF